MESFPQNPLADSRPGRSLRTMVPALCSLAVIFLAATRLWSAPFCLNPGDIAPTRLAANSVTLLALRDLPTGAQISITNRLRTIKGWENRAGAPRGDIVRWQADQPLAAGSQWTVALAAEADGLAFDLTIGDRLYFYTGTDHAPQFLYAVYFDENGYNWESPPRGLAEGLTVLTLGSLAASPGEVNHVYRPTDSTLAFLETPLGLLAQIAMPVNWIDAAQESPGHPIESHPFAPAASAGLVELAGPVFPASANADWAVVTLTRRYGYAGPVAVRFNTETEVPPFSQWTTQNSGTRDDLTSVARGPGLFVACGAAGQILVSVAGGAWTERARTDQPLYSIVWDGPAKAERYVAVGRNGRVFVSTNGVWWSSYTAAVGVDLYAVAWWNGQYLAAGNNGTAYVSATGEIWLPFPTLPGTGALFGLTVDGDRLWAVGAGASIYSIVKGQPWLRHLGLANGPALRSMAIDNGLYVVGGDYGVVAVSTDGLFWKPAFFGKPNRIHKIAKVAGLWLAAGAEGVLATSVNGYDWQIRRDKPGAPTLASLAFLENAVVAVGAYGTILHSERELIRLLSATPGVDFTPIGASTGQPLTISWEDGDSCPRQVSIPLHLENQPFERKRFDVHIEGEGGQIGDITGALSLRLGRTRASVSLLYIDENKRDTLRYGYGALARLAGVRLEVPKTPEGLPILDAPRTLRFQVFNTSPYAFRGGFVRFEGSNVADLFISPLEAGQKSPVHAIVLDEIVTGLSLYETFRNSDEPVFHHQVPVNNFYKTESAGAAFLAGNSAVVPVVLPVPQSAARRLSARGGLSGRVTEPPGGNPGESGYGLYLAAVNVTSDEPPPFTVGTERQLTATGVYFDPVNYLYVENIAPVEAWQTDAPELAVTPDGQLTVGGNPTVVYPRPAGSQAKVTTGAPVDNQGQPIPVLGQLAWEAVEAPGLSYSAWQATSQAGPAGADDDGDGWPNLAEYAFGSNPRLTDSPRPGLLIASEGSRQFFGFTRPLDRRGVRYLLEWSPDLSAWQPLDSAARTAQDHQTETWGIWLERPAPAFFRVRLAQF